MASALFLSRSFSSAWRSASASALHRTRYAVVLAGARALSHSSPLVSADTVHKLLRTPEALEEHGFSEMVVVDCCTTENWSEGCAWPPPVFAAAHVPGALPLPFDRKCKTETNDLLPPSTVDGALSLMGIGDKSLVVLYDAEHNLWASRVWWMMRYYGHAGARVMNGGLARWYQLGYPLEKSEAAKSFIATYADQKRAADPFQCSEVDGSWAISLAEMRESLGLNTHLVWDARSPAEFDGSGGPPNANKGHIPGAVNVEWTQLLNPETFEMLPREKIRQMFADAAGGDLKERALVTLCQKGIRGAFAALAAYHAGITDKPVLYERSMEEWGNATDVPIER